MIDIIYFGVLALAVFKGFSKGAIVALFSVIALIVGLAAAMKFSAITGIWLQENFKMEARWLPFLAFALVFLAAVLLVRAGAGLIEKTVELVMLGWLNKLAGIVIYAILYTVIFSVVLFYANKMGVINEDTLQRSVSYSFIQPWGPAAINWLAEIIPWFKNMFEQLNTFFEQTASGLSKP